MSELTLPIAITLAVLVLVLVLMLRSWRRRSRRDEAIALNHAVPEQLNVIISAQTLYVASTAAGQPLERLALRGLAFRARAEITVAAEGVVIAAQGELPVFIPASDVLGALPTTWTIDRVVEKDGLIALSWNTPASTVTTVDSYLRVIEQSDHAAILAAIASITRTPSTASATTESEI